MVFVDITAAGNGMDDSTYIVDRLVYPFDTEPRLVEIHLAGKWEEYRNQPDYDEYAGDNEFIDWLVGYSDFERVKESVVQFHMTR